MASFLMEFNLERFQVLAVFCIFPQAVVYLKKDESGGDGDANE